MKNKKCRVHNKELIYCKECVENLTMIEIIKVLRLDAKGRSKVDKEVLDEIRNLELIASLPRDRKKVYEFLIKSWKKKLKK